MARRPRRCAAWVSTVAILLFGASAHAQVRCATIAGGNETLADIDAETRLAFLQERIHHDARRARVWAWTWAGVYTGLTTYNAVKIGIATNRDDLIDASVGTAASALGLVVLGAMPLKVMRDQKHLDRLIAAARPQDDRCHLLAEAERFLLRDARSEAFGQTVLVHAGSFVFNVGLGLLLGIGFNHWSQGAIVAVVGIGVGAVQSATQPTDVIDTLARYRRGRLGQPTAARISGWTVTPALRPDGAGLRLGFQF